jgi:hypothetical protein
MPRAAPKTPPADWYFELRQIATKDLLGLYSLVHGYVLELPAVVEELRPSEILRMLVHFRVPLVGFFFNFSGLFHFLAHTLSFIE